MKFLSLYGRVLALLGPESRLGWMLASANVALAAAQFAEPVLFGRIIDTLVRIQTQGRPPRWADLLILLTAWAAFGLFTIGCGVLIALHADRLAHRRRQEVLTGYFEHALQLPLSFHGETHSGRLMKVMLAGTDALWALWLSFFREHLAAFVSLLVLLPLSLVLNWRLALLLIGLCAVFAVLTTIIMRKTQDMQSSVERHYSDLAERASDALSNVALVQGFARVEAEVSGLRDVVGRLLAAQIPVLSWWAVVTVLTRASTTITMLAIVLIGTVLQVKGLATIGEIVMFMSLATMLVARLEQAVGFANRVLMEAPRLREFMDVLDTTPLVREKADAVEPGRLHGLVEFDDVSFSYDGRRPAVEGLKLTVLPGQTVALVGATGAGKSTALALLHRAFDPQSG
ncbi:MAG TPA: ABC transporter transmembrane domain-containing protein, partial [Xanthobacteraceae bacterium]|nr:ABC transporter transmembrane domain-containing protein [Xanthobacteraceae bacterium]